MQGAPGHGVGPHYRLRFRFAGKTSWWVRWGLGFRLELVDLVNGLGFRVQGLGV